ncbi:MAG: TrmH family RNA methyltransferase [Anaerolineae bacterium]
MITSTSNSKVRLARALHRRRYRYAERRFLVEGVRLLEEVVKAGISPAFVLYIDDLLASQRGQALLHDLHELTDDVYQVTDRVLQAAADTVTPQGIVAVVPFSALPIPADSTLILVCDGVNDPGNLGTLLRTAHAAGVDHVILAPGTVDPYNPKVVRAGMGAHFRLPMTVAEDWPAITSLITGRSIWLADASARRAYYDVDWTPPSALIIGGEAHGAGPKARRLATGRVTIPMASTAESLNAAVAASVILFEARRQRALATQDRPGAGRVA